MIKEKLTQVAICNFCGESREVILFYLAGGTMGTICKDCLKGLLNQFPAPQALTPEDAVEDNISRCPAIKND
jgi:hypothetical protein